MSSTPSRGSGSCAGTVLPRSHRQRSGEDLRARPVRSRWSATRSTLIAVPARRGVLALDREAGPDGLPRRPVGPAPNLLFSLPRRRAGSTGARVAAVVRGNASSRRPRAGPSVAHWRSPDRRTAFGRADTFAQLVRGRVRRPGSLSVVLLRLLAATLVRRRSCRARRYVEANSLPERQPGALGRRRRAEPRRRWSCRCSDGAGRTGRRRRCRSSHSAFSLARIRPG